MKKKDFYKERAKHLDSQLTILYDRVKLLEDELESLPDEFYRTCIFGSARLKPETDEYKEVMQLARMLAWQGIDVLTGGGPGLMEAGNKGAALGKEEKNNKSLSIGLPIELHFEPEPNKHLDVKRHHRRFSSRLDDFMRLSDSVICTPGGIGTLLELFFSWQLIQVQHIQMRPIVLMDKSYWQGLMNWLEDTVLTRGLASEKDFNFIHLVDTPQDAFEIISNHYKTEVEKN